MAKSKKPANAGLLDQEPTSTHVALAAFINETVFGVEQIDAGTVALIQRAYPLYLKSPAVEAQKKAEREAKEREKAEREAKRIAAVRERLARIEAERQKALDELRKVGGVDPELELVKPVSPEPEPEVADVTVVEDDEPEVVVPDTDEFDGPDVAPDDEDESEETWDDEPEGDDDDDEF